jgi:3-mercaptopyruvate sulfurtransferase SseA
MAVPAVAVQKFPQSIARDSAEIAKRAGRVRLAIADARDAARYDDSTESARRVALYSAALREVA